jgi:hypothetical protein
MRCNSAMNSPLPRISHPGPLREIAPLNEEELRGLRKYLALVLEAHQVGVAQREMSEDRSSLNMQIQALQREAETRQYNIRNSDERERDRIAFGRRIAVLELRREMVEETLEKVRLRADGLRDQRDRVAEALLSVGMLTKREIEGT